MSGFLLLPDADASLLQTGLFVAVALSLVVGAVALAVWRLMLRPPPPRNATPAQRRYWHFLQHSGNWGPTSSVGPPNPHKLFVRHCLDIWATYPTLLAEFYLVQHNVTRARKETWAYAVSRANSCPFCAEIHGHIADLHEPGGNFSSLLYGARIPDSVPDESQRRQLHWLYEQLVIPLDSPVYSDAETNAGEPGGPEFFAREQFQAEPAPSAAPFSRAELPEMLGVVAVFSQANRLMNVYHGQRWTVARSRIIRRFLIPFLGTQSMPTYPAESGGAFLRASGLPELPSAQDMSGELEQRPGYTAAHTDIEQAFGQHPVMYEAGLRILRRLHTLAIERLPARVFAFLEERISASWPGPRTPVPMSRSWAHTEVDEHPESFADERERCMAAFGLLVAISSYQIDDGLLRATLVTLDGDANLLFLLTVFCATLASIRTAGTLARAAHASLD